VVLDAHLLQAGGVHVAAKDAVTERGIAVVAAWTYRRRGPGCRGSRLHDDALVGRLFVNTDRILCDADQVDIIESGQLRQERGEGQPGQGRPPSFRNSRRERLFIRELYLKCGSTIKTRLNMPK